LRLLGAAMAWPLATRAQQKTYRIGVLAASNPEAYRPPFIEALRALGYVEGKNIAIEFRAGDGTGKVLAGLAADLVKQKPDLLVAFQTPAAQAARQATSAIPIVMQSGDAVGTGLVSSLAKPGGNITGVSSATPEMGGKMLQLLRDVLPAVNRVGVLANRTDSFTRPFLEQIDIAAKSMSIETQIYMLQKPEEFPAAFDDMSRRKASAVIVQPSLPRKPAIDLALKHRLPSLSPTAQFSDSGGLLSYSASASAVMRQIAGYVDRVLKGAKPADLPVQLPSVFEMAVNLKTAKALGISIPRQVIMQADKVIE
jgi:putative ABC transport system substrate-binding protein